MEDATSAIRPFGQGDRVRIIAGEYAGAIGTIAKLTYVLNGHGPANRAGRRTRRYTGAIVRLRKIAVALPFTSLQPYDDIEGAVLRADANTPAFGA